jgi:sortase A
MKAAALRWLEASLFATALGLGGWCLATLLEARFTDSLAPVRVTMSVPSRDGARPTPPAAGTVIGKLEVPSVRLSTTVLEGSDDRTLARGAGHLEDTPLPGADGNVGIAGHRDTVFRRLKNIRAGDPLNLTTADHVFRYRVIRSLIVDPDDVEVLDPTAEPTLTLVTCYPFEYIGHAPRRFVVQARLMAEERREVR